MELNRSLAKENLYLLPEFNSRLLVLEKLEYIDSSRVILIKGRVAREINSCDELIATEMIFEGEFFLAIVVSHRFVFRRLVQFGSF